MMRILWDEVEQKQQDMVIHRCKSLLGMNIIELWVEGLIVKRYVPKFLGFTLGVFMTQEDADTTLIKEVNQLVDRLKGVIVP